MKSSLNCTLVYRQYTIDLAFDGNLWEIRVDQVLLMHTVRLDTAKRIAIKVIDSILEVDERRPLAYYHLGLRRA